MAPKCAGGLSRLAYVRSQLQQGGYVEFKHGGLGPIVVHAGGEWFSGIDGRSYQGFLISVAPKLKRTETGSVETKDLVIQWRM